MKREEVLDTAKKIVCSDRNEQYGDPERNFETIAALWTNYLHAAGIIKDDDPTVWTRITPKDVAAMMVLLKVARIATGKYKADSWIDIAGYAACGSESDGG